MAKPRKSHLPFFLLALAIQFFFPPSSLTADYLPLSRSPIVDPDFAGFRASYGEFSPSTALNLRANPSLKATMRDSITPLVLLSQFLVMTTLTDKIVYLLFVLCYSLCIFSWLIKKHPDI